MTSIQYFKIAEILSLNKVIISYRGPSLMGVTAPSPQGSSYHEFEMSARYLRMELLKRLTESKTFDC